MSGSSPSVKVHPPWRQVSVRAHSAFLGFELRLHNSEMMDDERLNVLSNDDGGAIASERTENSVKRLIQMSPQQQCVTSLRPPFWENG